MIADDHLQGKGYPASQSLNALFFGRGSFACTSRRLPTPSRRRLRLRPDHEPPGFRNSRSETLRRHWVKPNGEREQVVDRHTKRLAQNNRDRLPCRRQYRLPVVRRVAAVVDAVAMLPFADRLSGRAEPLRRRGCRLIAGPDRRPRLRGSACSHPALKVPQQRFCHEKRRYPRSI